MINAIIMMHTITSPNITIPTAPIAETTSMVTMIRIIAMIDSNKNKHISIHPPFIKEAAKYAKEKSLRFRRLNSSVRFRFVPSNPEVFLLQNQPRLCRMPHNTQRPSVR